MNLYTETVGVSQSNNAIGLKGASDSCNVVEKSESGTWKDQAAAEEFGVSGLADELNQGLELASAFARVKAAITKKLVGFFTSRFIAFTEDYKKIISQPVHKLQASESLVLVQENHAKVANDYRSPSMVEFDALSDLNLKFGDLFLKYNDAVNNHKKCKNVARVIKKLFDQVNESEISGVGVDPTKKKLMKENMVTFLDTAKLPDFQAADDFINERTVLLGLLTRKFTSAEEMIKSFTA